MHQLWLWASIVLFWLIPFAISHGAEKLVLGYTNLRGAKVPIPLGVDEGLFAKYGIDLHIGPVTPGTQGVPKLLSGEIDLFLGNSGPVVSAIALEGQKLAMISSLGPDRFLIFSRPEIQRVEDLRGKKIGSSISGASVDRNTKKALRKIGLDPERDVQIIYTGHQNSFDRLKVLARGEVDATVAGTDALPELGQAKDKVHKLLDLIDIGIYVSGADVSAKRDLLHGRRYTVQKFLRALEESYRLAKARPDLVRRTYQRHLRIETATTLDVMVQEYLETKVPDRPFPDRRAIQSHIEELLTKHPNIPKDVRVYTDESFF